MCVCGEGYSGWHEQLLTEKQDLLVTIATLVLPSLGLLLCLQLICAILTFLGKGIGLQRHSCCSCPSFRWIEKCFFSKWKKKKKRKTTNTSTQTKAGTIGFVFLTYTGCLAFTTLCNTCWTRFEFKTSKDKVLGFLKKCFKFALPDGLKMSSEPSPIFVYTCGDSSTRSEYMQNIYKRGFRSTALSFSLLSAKDIPAFLHPPQPSVHVLLYCNCIQCTTITCTHLS